MSSHAFAFPKAIALLRSVCVITFCSGHRNRRKCAVPSFGLNEFTFFGPLAIDVARTSKEHSGTSCSSHVNVDLLVELYLQVCSVAPSPCLVQYPLGYV